MSEPAADFRVAEKADVRVVTVVDERNVRISVLIMLDHFARVVNRGIIGHNHVYYSGKFCQLRTKMLQRSG